jgi:hypothetical protein
MPQSEDRTGGTVKRIFLLDTWSLPYYESRISEAKQGRRDQPRLEARFEYSPNPRQLDFFIKI